MIPAQGDRQPALASSAPPSESDLAVIGISAQRKASWRLLPVIAVGYGLAYMDRINISFASLRMNSDLHFSATVYGLGAGLFFIGYALCEVPSNLLLLHYGPKRWLARIMLTWGLLATAMMFVRTPLEFYGLRLLLGMAEAGFYPGVIYYLTLWFPAKMRARAVSRFYVSLPLSSVVMGSVAGWLLGLQGKFGLAGWQWLFLVEGMPAALFSLVILKMLPDTPSKASWLTGEEKAWLLNELEADGAKAHLGHGAKVTQALLSPNVWMIGAYFFFALTTSYAYSFSAPAILQGVTGWSVTHVGYLVACFGLAGAAGMILNSAHSDRTEERAFHCIVPCCGDGGWLHDGKHCPGALACGGGARDQLCFVSWRCSGRQMQCRCSSWLVVQRQRDRCHEHHYDVLGFVGPYWMGVMKDDTGSYEAGLKGLALPSMLAAGTMFALTRSLTRTRSRVAQPPDLAEETA